MEVRSTNNYSCNICVEDFFPSDNFLKIAFTSESNANKNNKNNILQ